MSFSSFCCGLKSRKNEGSRVNISMNSHLITSRKPFPGSVYFNGGWSSGCCQTLEYRVNFHSLNFFYSTRKSKHYILYHNSSDVIMTIIIVTIFRKTNRSARKSIIAYARKYTFAHEDANVNKEKEALFTPRRSIGLASNLEGGIFARRKRHQSNKKEICVSR